MVKKFSSVFSKKKSDKILEMDFQVLNICNAVSQVEAALDQFLLRTDIGDVFCWDPYSGKPPSRCDELNNRIVVSISPKLIVLFLVYEFDCFLPNSIYAGVL